MELSRARLVIDNAVRMALETKSGRNPDEFFLDVVDADTSAGVLRWKFFAMSILAIHLGHCWGSERQDRWNDNITKM